MNGRRTLAAVITALALVLAACGSSSKSTTAGSATTTPTTTHVVSKTLGRGVTASTVKLGISLVDFTCIEQYVNSIRTNQQAGYQAFIDDINAKGGINGRKIVAVFKTYCPITGTSELNVQVCTGFADDDKVFAVIGNLSDAGSDGAVETCLAKKHQTPVMSFDLTRAIINQSPPGMVIFPGTTPERKDGVLLDLLHQKGLLNGKKVAVLATTSEEAEAKTTILPKLKQLGIPTGTSAYLSIAGTDTTAAQAQLSSFIERWKSENVNSVYVAGENVASQQFMEKLAQGMPGVMLMTNVDDVRTFGQEEKTAGIKPNPYQGMYLAGGYNPKDYVKGPNYAYCAAIWKKYTGKTAPTPDEVIPGPDGKTLDTYGNFNDACQTVSLFADVATKVGPYLNTSNWVSTVDSYGNIANRGGGPYASLKTGKYDFDDTFQLQSFDENISKLGDWKALGPYQNISS